DSNFLIRAVTDGCDTCMSSAAPLKLRADTTARKVSRSIRSSPVGSGVGTAMSTARPGIEKTDKAIAHSELIVLRGHAQNVDPFCPIQHDPRNRNDSPAIEPPNDPGRLLAGPELLELCGILATPVQ